LWHHSAEKLTKSELAKGDESAAIARVGKLAQAYWESDSNPNFLKHGPEWVGERWSRVLDRPELVHFAWKPEWEKKITRELLLECWEDAGDKEGALEAFFLTMAWGFGANFRGPWKTFEMLKSMRERDFGAYLLEVRAKARHSNEEAYRSLLSKRVTQLGPVYASKLLYAMSPAGNRSPVMDMWIERWGQRMFELDFRVHSSSSIDSNVAALSRFTTFCESALDAVSKSAPASRPSSESDVGFIEYLIFWDAKYKWSRWKRESEFPAWIQNVNLV
jgi:hypothetical protein